VRPRDLTYLRIVSDPRIHPDGVRVAFAVSRPNVEEDRYDRQIWVWDGQRAESYTQGPHDGSPRWSPDGRWLAFLRKEENDKAHPQVAVMSTTGGEANIVTDLPLGASDLVWSPDSTKLAVIGSVWRSDVADRDDDERGKRPKRITRLPYRGDGIGFIHDRRSHLFLVDVDGGPGDEVCLTAGDDFDEHGPVWHPDGSSVAFLSARHDEREVRPDEGVFSVDIHSHEVTQLVDPGSWNELAYAPDGTLHLVGVADPFAWPASVPVQRMTPDGFERLTEDHNCETTPPQSPGGPRFRDDGSFLVAVEDAGRVNVLEWTEETGVRDFITGDRCVTGVDPTPDGRAAVFTATSPDSPGELYWFEDGQERQLTDLNRGFIDTCGVHRTEHFRFEREGADIDAWVVLPESDEPAPLLLNIHGGPTSQYGFYFFDEFQVYAAAGYVVVGINPRGSSGRGTDWSRAVVGAWDKLDSVDMLDLLSAVDATIERFPDRIDPDRIGVMGGSYGGFAAARLTALTDRFRSSVVERGLLVWESFGGTSDIGPFFDRMFLVGLEPLTLETLQAASPLSYIDRVSTPTLVLHSDEDWRCPVEQAEQYFGALRRQGVEAEFVRFPGEGHELSRSGRPKHRVERFDVILEWHGRHMGMPWTIDSLQKTDDE
jgi:dipeptidyl aminopeptidase/acylaminoacyl peptidase